METPRLPTLDQPKEGPLIITSKYPGSCLQCRRGIAIGDRVEWQKGQRGVRCFACSDEGAEEMARLLKEWGYAHGSGKKN